MRRPWIRSSVQVHPSLHFDATLSVLPPRLPPSVPCYVDRNPATESTSHELSDPSAYSDKGTLFFTYRLIRVQEGLLCLLEVPSSGFGYPLDGVRSPSPWEPLSVPNALGFRSSELCSSPEIENSVSKSSFRSDVFLRNLTGLAPTFQRLALSGEAVPLVASRWFRSGRDLLALLSIPTSRASPSTGPTERLFLPLSDPLSSFVEPDLTIRLVRDPRVFRSQRLGFLPPWRAPARLALFTDCVRYLLEK